MRHTTHRYQQDLQQKLTKWDEKAAKQNQAASRGAKHRDKMPHNTQKLTRHFCNKNQQNGIRKAVPSGDERRQSS